jgi:transcriptional regulator with XRE-family HTH domain
VILKALIRLHFARTPRNTGEHILKRCREQGLFQRDVAECIGVDPITIHNWETGKSSPAIIHYPAIIRFLGYDPEATCEQTLPELLKAKRREHGWTQRQVAEALNVDPSTVTSWEQGDIVLKHRHRQALAQYLGLNEDEFLKLMRERWTSTHRKARLG